MTLVLFAILYTEDAEHTGGYHVFQVKDTAQKVTEKRMRDTWYPSEAKGSYFFYRFDEEVSSGKIKIVDLLKDLRKSQGESGKGPLFITAAELIAYREGV